MYYILDMYDPIDHVEQELAIELMEKRIVINGYESLLSEDDIMLLISIDGIEYVTDEIIFDVEEDEYGLKITTDSAFWDLLCCDINGIPYINKKKLFKRREKTYEN